MASRMDTLGLSLFSQIKADFQSFMRGSQHEGGKGPSPAFVRMSQLIEGNNVEALKAELSGIDAFTVMERGANEVTLLHIAAEVGNLEMVRLLILAGAQLDVSDRNGWAPLHCAARNGHEEVITALFSAGADCNITTLDRNTPLHYFVRSADPTHKYYYPVLAMLIKHSSGLVNLTNRLGETVLHFAAIGNKNVAAKQLLDAGANPGFANKYGESPLHLAARNGNTELVELFLEHGASPLKVGRNGTPGQVALTAFKGDIAQRLKAAEYEWKQRRRTTEHENTMDALRRLQGAQNRASEEFRSSGSKRPAKQAGAPKEEEQKESSPAVEDGGSETSQSTGPARPPVPPRRARAKSEVSAKLVATISRIPTLNTGLTASQALNRGSLSARGSSGSLGYDSTETERVGLESLEEPSTGDEIATNEEQRRSRVGRAATCKEPGFTDKEHRKKRNERTTCSTDGAVPSRKKSKKKARKMSTRAKMHIEEEVIAFNSLLVEEEPSPGNTNLYKERRVSVMCLEEQEKPVEVPREVEQVVPLHRLPSWEQLPSMQSEDSVDYLKFKNALLREELAALKDRLLQADMELTVTHKLLDNTETRLRNAQNDNFRLQKKMDLMRKECTCR